MFIQGFNTLTATWLDLDKPVFMNTVASTALSALQYLREQKKYQSLNGITTPLPQAVNQSPPDFFRSVLKVIVYVSALILVVPCTPIGIVARLLSLLSPDVRASFAFAFLLNCPENMRFQFQKNFPSALPSLIALQEKKNLEMARQALHQKLEPALKFLEVLEQEMKAPEMTKDRIEEWLTNQAEQPNYPHPFAFARTLKENSPADPVLLNDFKTVHQRCCAELDRFESTAYKNEEYPGVNQEIERLKETMKRLGIDRIIPFFQALKAKLEKQEIPEIIQWLKEEKEKTDYPYGFYTTPHIMKMMAATKRAARQIEVLAKIYNSCIQQLKDKGLSDYLNETPSEKYASKEAFIEALGQLKTIQSLQG